MVAGLLLSQTVCLGHWQRQLKHKPMGSHRLATARRQLATLHAAVADKRLDGGDQGGHIPADAADPLVFPEHLDGVWIPPVGGFVTIKMVS